ncbi:helix-turn-helix domain-containing protein [Pseudactinotalea terrae]|uniref:helix-turn-helix domain-containing protein n=1 Tax=Pseudactinotalea terrae TaxID=1743262 RepID=UPI0012E2D02E|nr:helix-turn-helix domain-containing protein [Pseudactinotalea terrae]
MSTQPDDVLTRAEAAQAARVSRATLDRWIATGHLPVVRLGRRVLVTRSALAALLDAATVPATRGPLAGRRG